MMEDCIIQCGVEKDRDWIKDLLDVLNGSARASRSNTFEIEIGGARSWATNIFSATFAKFAT